MPRSCEPNMLPLKRYEFTALAVTSSFLSLLLQLWSFPFFSSIFSGPFHSQPLHLWSLHQLQPFNPILGNLIPEINTQNTMSSIVLYQKIIRFQTNAETV